MLKTVLRRLYRLWHCNTSVLSVSDAMIISDRLAPQARMVAKIAPVT